MPDLEKKTPLYKIGDKVKVHLAKPIIGYVSEVRYVPSGSGRITYRVYLPMNPDPMWWEFEEGEMLEKA